MSDSRFAKFGGIDPSRLLLPRSNSRSRRFTKLSWYGTLEFVSPQGEMYQAAKIPNRGWDWPSEVVGLET